MDLFFEPQGVRVGAEGEEKEECAFSIEVGYFDTVKEIKEKIEKYRGIPAPKQTLIFNGGVLHDHLNVHFSDILDRSRIQLKVPEAAHSHDHKEPKKQEDQGEGSPSNSKITIISKFQSSTESLKLEMNPDDTIRQLKEKIQKERKIPIEKQALYHSSGVSLGDHKTMTDCAFVNNTVLHVFLFNHYD